ncbi:AAA family ATPase [Rhizobium sp. P28RR-XV]|uniref:AAA family ATPase n=1 Tax=Rhizobium sp. P28RR-XV TaxID=2726737 RepID=UPI001456FA24|nr:AAA family ATPase [Rhizobium sp. P28RR-XV]NLR88267.1 AAA family ATPase [Rhizobium sp. P28RR-XV]
MKIDRLFLQEFRGIPKLEIAFDDRITVIVGRNGQGKTSILDALATILQSIQLSWPSEGAPGLYHAPQVSVSDRRHKSNQTRVRLDFSFEKAESLGTIPVPSMLEAGYTDSSDNQQLGRYNEFWQYASAGGLAREERPLMVYYRQDRGFDANPHATEPVDRASTIMSSLNGQLKAISHLETWWDKRDAQEARRVRDKDQTYRDPQLEAIRALIKQIDGFSDVSYSSTNEPEGLYFEKLDGTMVHVSVLSSGERSFIILLADLARRLQTMEPGVTLAEISGIVLIDEIELNLHPAWQSKIITTLQSVFLKCQFVITTHSPQVVSAVESDHVRALSTRDDGEIEAKTPLRTKGQTSNYLLEGVFEADERLPEVAGMFDQFNIAIESKNLRQAKSILAKISKSIEGDPPELLVLRKRLKQLGDAA